MLEDFITPEFIRVTECHAWQGTGNTSNMKPGSVHEVLTLKTLENEENRMHVQGVSTPIRLFSDEYSALWPVGTDGKARKGEKFSQEEIEKFRKDFEKSRLESKKSIIFAKNNSISNNLKNKNRMSSKTKGQMTKTEIAVMEGIATVTNKKTSNKSLIGKEANLSEVDAGLSGIDTAKVARKMKRSGLLTYEWATDKEGARTGERLLAVTQEGFDILQLGAKEPAKKAAKKAEDATAAPKGKKKAAKKAAEKAPAKKEPAVSGVAGSTKDDPEFLIGDEDSDFSVEVNAKAKTFTVNSTYGEHQLKVKTLKAFKAAKEYTEENWLTNIEDGNLTELD